jgi:hypothetical protein
MWARRGDKSKLNALISKWPVASDEDAVKHAVLAMIVVKARLVHGRAVVDDKHVAQLVFVHIDELRTDCNFQKFVEETLKRLPSVRSGSFLPCRAMVSQLPKSSLSVRAVEAIDCALARSSALFFGVEKPWPVPL